MTIITKPNQLNDLCAEIDACGRFAVDLEFIPERTYHPELCLVQVATDSNAYIVDPIAMPELMPLWQRVADPKIRVVFHAGDQDLDLIFRASSLVPQNIIDTQIAAGFIGFGYPIGYGKLLQTLLGINLAKTESHTDWLIRPLTEAQIAYALDDVRHLLPMYDQMELKLNEVKRTTWVEEECKRYCAKEYYDEDRERKYLRIKGASTLSRRGLACLQKMYAWRDALAFKGNRPARTILSDSIILELSRRPPKNAQEMQRVRSVRVDQIAKYGADIMKVVEEVQAMSNDDLPFWPASMGPPKKEVLQADMLYAILKVLCYEADLAPELVATRDELQALVRVHREDALAASNLPLLHGWRRQLAGQVFISLMDGCAVSVSLSGGNSPVKLEFS